MKIKIVSDGTPLGTSVVDAATGEPIDGVTAIQWRMKDCGSAAEAVLEFELVACELVGDGLVAKVVEIN